MTPIDKAIAISFLGSGESTLDQALGWFHVFGAACLAFCLLIVGMTVAMTVIVFAFSILGRVWRSFATWRARRLARALEALGDH